MKGNHLLFSTLKEERINTILIRKQNQISPKIKFGGYGWKAAGLEQSKITAKPVKYIVPGICGRDAKTGKFAKQMNA